MSESFDPYRKWLGIPASEQPANHYRLLGIALFEDDPDVIAYAADRQMSHVRKFQSGQFGQQAQKLLSELAQARRCLLASSEKAAYDKQLKAEQDSGDKGSGSPVAAPQPSRPVQAPVQAPSQAPVQAPPQQAPQAPPQQAVATAEPPQAVPVAVASTPVASGGSPVAVRSRPVTSKARRGRKNSAIPVIGALVALAGLAVVALVAVVAATSQLPEDESSDDGTSVVTPTPVPMEDPQPKPKPQPNPTPDVRPQPEDQPQPPNDEEPETDGGESDGAATVPTVEVNDPQRQAKYEEAVTALEAAMAGRDMSTAGEQLAIADALKYSAQEQSQMSHLQELHDRLVEFWEAVDRGLERLKPNDDVVFAGKIANFVSAEDGQVTLLALGNRKTETLKELDAFYMVAIARRGLSKTDPNAFLVAATFLALDGKEPPSSQLEEAASLFERAVAGGAKSDALRQRLKIEDAPSLPAPGGSDEADSDVDDDAEASEQFPEPGGSLPKPGEDEADE